METCTACCFVKFTALSIFFNVKASSIDNTVLFSMVDL